MQNLGNFIPSEFSLTPVIANDFIPLVAMNTIITKEGNLQYYSKPSFEKHLRKPNTLKNIKDGFELGGTTRRIEINGRVFFIAKGVFFSEAGVPLMVCAMKKEAFLDVSVFRFSDYNSDTFSYNNYVLFYSTSFYTDPGLMPLNRRLQKEILQACFEKGIEVRTITSLEIEKNTFARLFEVKKTKSLTQLEAYMNQVLPNFLHTQGEDTFVEQEFEPVVIHREELSVEDEALLFDSGSISPAGSLYTTHNVTGSIAELSAQATTQANRQLTLEEVIEMAELEAEAAQFDPVSESSDEEDYTEDYNEDWENDEQDEDEEEMQRHEEAAHTVSERSVQIHTNLAGARMFQEALRTEISNSLPHPAASLVERMRPLQDAYNIQMLQAQQSSNSYHNASDRVIADALASLAMSRNSIELIDDTE
jgi:hypothetical protein